MDLLKSKIRPMFFKYLVAASGSAMIILLPLILGANSVWYAMLITEILVAVFSVIYMIRCTKELGSANTP